MSNPAPTHPNNPSASGGIHNESVPKMPASDAGETGVAEAGEEDQQVIDAFKEDANGVLVFTAVFSAVVAAFIIEFYKKLPSDFADETATLLRQISQQLSSIPNSSNFDAADQSLHKASMVLAISLWLISLIFSLASAMIAMMFQQWTRRYVDTPRDLAHRVRIRKYLFHYTYFHQMAFLVEMLPIILHFSVCMFFAGLVITFHTIHRRVAVAVDVAIGLVALAYVLLTIFPVLDSRSPYRTPLSYFVWYLYHTFIHSTVRWLSSLV